MSSGRKCKLPSRNIREASSQIGENKFIVAARLGVAEQQGIIPNTDNMSTDEIVKTFYHLTNINNIDFLKKKGIIHKYEGEYYITLDKTKVSKGDILTSDRIAEVEDRLFTTLRHYNISDSFIEDIKPVMNRTALRVRFNEEFMPKSNKDEDYIVPDVSKVVSFFEQKIPNLKIHTISTRKAKDILGSRYNDRVRSFVKGNEVYLIASRVDGNIAIEECLHPFVNTLFHANPKLFNELHKEAVRYDSELADEITKNYEDFGINDVKQELVTRVLTEYLGSELIEEEPLSLKELANKFVLWFKEFFGKIFYNKNTEGKYVIDDFSMLNTNMTFSDLSKLINAYDSTFVVHTDSTFKFNLDEEESTDSPELNTYAFERTFNNPIIRRNRINLIVNIFNEYISSLIREKEESQGDNFKHINRLQFIREYEGGLKALLEEIKEFYIKPFTLNYRNDNITEEEYKEAEELLKTRIRSFEGDISEEELEEIVSYYHNEYDLIGRYFNDLVFEARDKLYRMAGIKVSEDTDPDEDSENTPKEYYDIDLTTVSGYKSLTAMTRFILSDIPDEDINGDYPVDDLYNPIYVQPERVYATLVQINEGAKSSDEMMTRIEDNENKYPWLRGLRDKLEYNENYKVEVFTNTNKGFMPYDVITDSNQALTVNLHSSSESFYNQTVNNINNGNIIGDIKESVYDSSGNILHNNVNSLKTKLKEADKLKPRNLEDFTKIVNTYTSVLRALGFIVTEEDVINSTQKRNIFAVFSDVKAIINDLSNMSTTEDLLLAQSSRYKKISDLFKHLSQGKEASIRDNSKTRYSYILPSFLSDFIYGIHNNFKETIDKYFNFSYFKRSENKFYNNWLNFLYSDSSDTEREKFYIKNVLRNQYGKDYSDWSEVERLEVVLSEFGYFENNGTNSIKNTFSSYMMRTMSDAGTVLFINAPRYDDKSFKSIWGELNSSYKNDILNALVNVVYQEVVKINDIIDRMNRRKAGERLPIIDGYDDNPVFTFFPQLNNYVSSNGKSFLEEFTDKANDKNAREEWLKEELEKIVNSEFNAFLWYMDSVGAFSGNIPKLNVVSSAAKQYQKEIKPIVENLVNTKAISKEYRKLLNETLKTLDKASSFRELRTIINQINEELKFQAPNVQYPEIQNIEQSKLEHFFWNDYLANIYIAQLQVGSPQFYGSVVNYYKRGKEGYAMNRKVDTAKLSNFRMVTVADQYYQADDNTSDILKNSLRKLVAKGKIDSTTAKKLLSSMTEINETDGEAFISLDTYRNIMLATNPDLWTEKHEIVFTKLKNNEPLDKDNGEYDIIMQIMKPFVFSKVDMYNGSKPAVMPLPYQNKNSIMVLLPNMIKGNKKLEALNKLLNEGNIDMIQFQSAVKVGAQGVINMDTDGDLFTHMISQVRDSSGQEYGGMVTIVDARNFGIQSETPPHYMDSDTNIAVQMRRIMFAYGTQEDITEMDEIITDLVKSNYNKVKELFHPTTKSKESLYLKLKEQLQNDGRSTTDAIKAVTPNSKDELPIPICNPLNDGTLVPKIIALLKRIQKQKIDGGALIQASSLGTTNIQSDESLDINFNEDGTIESIDCLVPITFKDILDTYGDINIDTVDSEGNYIIPEDMRKLIAFRIPSEGACSVVPLRIKGFLPATSGGTIITHPIVFTLTGSDLDVDKLFFMKKSYYRNKSGKYVENKKKKNLNRLFDLFWKTIHSEEYQEDMLIASDFSELKDTAKFIESLSTKKGSVEDLASTMSKLKSAHVNIAGKNLIGPIALHSSNALLLKNYPSKINSSMYFKIDNTEFTEINSPNSYLAVKKYLAAVVDNAKYPVLSIIGITQGTIRAGMALVRAGFDSKQIALLFNQPTFKQIVINSIKSSQSLARMVKDYVDLTKEQLGYPPKDYITSEVLEDCIKNPNNNDINYINNQYTVINIINNAFIVGDYLSEYVSNTRFDSANATPSLSLETVENNIQRVDKFYEEEPIIDLPRLTSPTHNEEEANNSMEDSSLVVKFIQAMFGYSYGGGMDLLRSIFPQLSTQWKSIIANIGTNISLRDSDVKFINREIMEYLMSTVFEADKALKYVNNTFVKKIADIIQEARNNKEKESESEIDEIINDNKLLQNLLLKGNQISIENAGAFSKDMKQYITDSWRGLVLSEYDELRNLGLDLFRYAAYNYGLYFKPNNYVHLVPFEAQLLLPGYADRLHEISTLNNIDFNNFLTQFYIKNRGNDKYVKIADTISNAMFKSTDGVSNHYDIDLFLVEDNKGNKLVNSNEVNMFQNNTPKAFKIKKENNTDVYIQVPSSSGTLTYAKYSIANGETVLYDYNNNSNELYTVIKEKTTLEEKAKESLMFAISAGAFDMEGVISQTDYNIPDYISEFSDLEGKTQEALYNEPDYSNALFIDEDFSSINFDSILPNESCPII